MSGSQFASGLDRGAVPGDIAHLKRFPFVLLVDTSGSTGFEPHPDINYINKALADFINVLREPEPGSALDREHDKIDVCVIEYSDQPKMVLDWTVATQLPHALQALKPDGGTATGAALIEAYHAIGRRIAYYQTQNISRGRAHIIHFTDGAMKDIAPGTPEWSAIGAKIAKLSGVRSERQKVPLINFISPKGDNGEKVDALGRSWSGRDLLTELSGDKAVFDLNASNPTESFETLVKLTTTLMTSISTGVGTEDAIDAVRHERYVPNAPPIDVTEYPPGV